MQGQPTYPYAAINSMNALSKMLGEHKKNLLHFSINSSQFYKEIYIPKKSGGTRLITNPHPKLKKIQRKINKKILSKVTYPLFLHGSIKDATFPRTPISNTRPHLKSKQVIALDIENFYPSIEKKQIYFIFRQLFLFSPDVSELLTNLCSYNEKLPQGAPTSCYLSNLLFWDTEQDVVDFIKERNGNYSRYVDDVTISFSYKISKKLKRDIIEKVIHMAKNKGCHISRRKTKIFRRGQTPAGFVITGVSINHNYPSASKDYRREVRAQVHYVTNISPSATSLREWLSLYNSVLGKLERLRQLGHKEYLPLKNSIEQKRISMEKQFSTP